MTDNITHQLKALCILDGRNNQKVNELSNYFSEFALFKYRIQVEIKYLLYLSAHTKIFRKIDTKETKILESIFKDFNIKDAIKIKEIENKINHDLKAVEYYIGEKIKNSTLKDISPFIHFGLTSYDINIPAYALILDEYRNAVLIPQLKIIQNLVKYLTIECSDAQMLARTHGQPALPTTMGKEMSVFYNRIIKEKKILENHSFEAKLTGAVGNFNALSFVYPDYDWLVLSEQFITSLGLTPNVVTTQILPYDNWLSFFDSLKRVNNILLNFVQDIWWYISYEYFHQKNIKNEVGSSTMSHKINPISFENAEGNLGVANSLFEFFVRKLSLSRLQRDLSDSTVKRDFGLAFGFTYLAWDNIISGLGRISPDSVKMKIELDTHWEIYAEGVQTYLRSKGFRRAFEILKEKTRGKRITKVEFYTIIDSLPINKSDKKKLKIKSLDEYLGLAKKIAKRTILDK